MTDATKEALKELRQPRNVEAIFKRPLRRPAQYGIPVCDLQLRTFSVRNMEFFADFAMRAAYYLGLPAKGPIPLPRKIERWTVPRANFVFKKSQEYGKDKAKFSLVAGLLKQVIDTAFIRYGLMAWSWTTGGWIISKFGFGPEYEVSVVSRLQARTRTHTGHL